MLARVVRAHRWKLREHGRAGVVRSPTFTQTEQSVGTNTSTREPNRMIPMRSPCSTRIALAVGHDPSRDQPGDLPNENAALPRFDPDRHLLVLEARFLGGGVEELALVVLHVPHDAVHRIPVHVHVEHVHEDRDANRAAVHERRLVDFGDHDDLAVGRRDRRAVAALAGALGIAEEVRDPERDERERRRRAARAATSAGASAAAKAASRDASRSPMKTSTLRARSSMSRLRCRAARR